MLNLARKRFLQRKLLSLILIGIIVEGFIGFVDIPHVFGQPIIITLKWRKNASIGSTWMGPLAADLNNDGLMEIVITAKNGVAALDPISGNVIWSAPYGGDHCCFEIIDLNKDGIPEIILSVQTVNGQRATGVAALHGNNGSVYWYNPSAAGDGNYIAVADINADGYPEIFSANPGKITALSYDGRLLRRVYTYYTCWGGLSIGDTDFDGVFELYLGERSDSYPSYPSGGRGLRAFWADNLTERWAHTDILCSSQTPVLADVDKDGDLEIIVHHQSSSGGIAVINTDGSVNTYNGIYRKNLQIWDLGRGHVNPPVADVDDDGNLEIILCGDASHNRSPPKIWDLVDWKLDATLPFPSMDPGTVADIDGDGKLEIIQPNDQNVTIFKYNPATADYDIIYTIPLSMAHAFSIAQDIDGDGKLELVFDQYNSWVSVYDVEAPAPTPLPRSGFYFYSQYRTRAAVHVPPPEQPPRISEISPNDGATSVSVSLSELSFKLTDYQSEPMDYTVTTNPNIGSGSGINVPNGKITIPVSGLAPSTIYTWTVTATDGTYSTTRTFTFYTEGNVVLTISTVGTGSVIKNPDSETYAYGTPVQLTAVADNVVYTFSHWDGDLAWMGNNNPATILMNGNKTVIAVFTKIEYRLRTNVSPQGSGTITLNNTGPYYYGDAVQLTAEPNTGWYFSQWERDLTGSQNPATIIIDNNKRVTAVFTQDQYNLTITVIGNGNVTIEPDKTTYADGENVTLTATADPDWTFAGWTGDASGTANPITVNMTSDKTVTATFAPAQGEYTITASAGTGGSISPSGSVPVNYGEDITFTIAPNIGYHVADVIVDGSTVGAVVSYTFTAVQADHSISASFAIDQYTITASAETGGSINPSGSLSVSYGDSKTFTITADPGYHIADVLVDSVSVGAAPSYTFSAVDADHTISASFAINQYTITASAGLGGIIDPSGSVPVAYEETKTFTITPDVGYHVVDVVVDGSSAGAVSSYTFTAVTADHSISASFAINEYTITASAGDGGSISPSGSVQVNHGEDKSFTIAAYTGYHIGDVLVDGLSVGAVESYTFTSVTSGHTISASFALNQFTITASAGPGGSITPSGAVPVAYGEDKSFTIAPDMGYHVFDVVVDGFSQGVVYSYTFSDVSSDHTISASFAINQYTITASAGPGGSISPVGSVLVNYGESETFTITPNDVGYHIADVLVDSVSVGAISEYTFSAVSSNHTISASFAINEYTITASAGPGGVITPSGSVLVNYGADQAFTITADTGYHILNVSVDGEYEGAISTYTFYAVNMNQTITAFFAPNEYTLTVDWSPEEGGTVTRSNTGPYYYGDAVELTAEPNTDTGWYFSHWEGDLLGSQNPATIIIDGDTIITAVFTQEKLILSITIIGKGSVIKEPDKTIYTRDETVTLTAIAEPDWTFSGWSGDLSGLVNPATITMTGNITVTATFTINQWWCRDWQYRRTITIDRTKVSGTLTDFPVLIEILDSSLIGKTQPNGYDFVFTDANNVKLDHQIEFYDSTIGHLIVWVKVPYLSSTTDTLLYMYYGNPTCENQQNSTEVWDTNYKLVLHLNENTGTLYDSTINGNNGTPFKNVLQGVTGKIDGAVTFDGNNDYIETPHSDTLAGYTEAFTVSFWINLENTAKRQTILSKYATSALMRSWMIEYNPADWPNNPFWFAASQDGMTYSEWWASFVPQANTWYYVTVVWETNTVPRFYINGVQVATVGTSTVSSIFNNVGVPLRIGRNVYCTRRFKGSLDEITISNQARSADWILTAYNNQLNPTTFYSVGAEETFQETYILTLHMDGNGSVTITPEKTAYTQGETVTLTATPEEGYEFQGWSGDLTGTDNPTNITITKNMNITAHFTLK